MGWGYELDAAYAQGSINRDNEAIVTYYNDLGYTAVVTSISMPMGTGSGSFYVGDQVYANGNPVTFYVTCNGRQSSHLVVSNVVTATNGFPPRDSMIVQSLNFNPGIQVSPGGTLRFLFTSCKSMSSSSCLVWDRTRISGTVQRANVTVTFNLDGGTRTGGGSLSQTISYGGSATAPTCIRDQCNFVRWDRSLSNITSDVTITAIWDYIIIYDTSELYYITLPDQIKHKNESLTLDSTDLSSENLGHEHTGWATTSGGPAVYSLGGNYVKNDPCTLYPAWDVSKETFQVTFDLRGGTSSGGSLIQSIVYGDDAVPPNNPTKSGKRFVGWLGKYTDITSDRIIYAMWDASPLWIFTGSEWIPFSS